MAIFRKVHTVFWGDSFIQSLTPERKYFFLYLLTNEKTKQCGIYEITKKQIEYDIGYNIDTVSLLLKYFIDAGKIAYSSSTNEIAIKNWKKYNDNSSPTVKILVNQELANVKNKSLIEYIHSKDTVSIPHREEEEEEEPEKEPEKELNVSFDEFWKSYDKKTSPKPACEKKWSALKDSERQEAIEYIPEYKLAQPDKQFRKDPATFLNQKAWNNEIIYRNGTSPHIGKSSGINRSGKKGTSEARTEGLSNWGREAIR